MISNNKKADFKNFVATGADVVATEICIVILIDSSIDKKGLKVSKDSIEDTVAIEVIKEVVASIEMV